MLLWGTSNQRRGFTVAEIMISLVMMSLISLTALSFLSSIRIDTRKQESVTYRNNETGQFLMQIVQPQYVGALADYSENKALLQCLEADTNLCDTKTSYPLVAYDLATAQPILHLDSGAKGLVSTQLSFKVHCPMEQASCDAVDYVNITIKTSVLGNLGISLVNEKVVTVEPKRTNVLTFVPNTVVEDGAPANIILFIDGSNSMGTIKSSFKTTLANFLNSIQNMNVTIGVYSLNGHTQTYKDGLSYTLDGSGNKTFVSDVQSLPAGTQFYADYKLRMPYIQTVTVHTLKHDMTAGQRTTVMNAINTQIENIFAANSPGKDAGLCGFLRGLDDVSEGFSGFTINDTTPNMVMVLTNENDESILTNVGDKLDWFSAGTYQGWKTYPSFACLKSYTAKSERQSGGRVYSANTNYYQYTTSGDFSVDGVTTRKDVSLINIREDYSASLTDGADCMSMLNAARTDKINSAMKNAFFGTPYLGNLTVKTCTVKTPIEGQGVSDKTKNFCETVYNNTAVYTWLVPNTCKYTDNPDSSAGNANLGETVKEVYVPEDTIAHSSNDITLAVYNKIKNNFKLSNFNFTAVINPSSGICPATPGSEVGSLYEKLAGYSKLSSQIIPICSSTYESSFLNSANFLKQNGLGDFTLPPGKGAKVKGVDVVRGANILMPTQGEDYVLNGDILSFTAGYLQSTDIVRVYLK